MEHPFLTGQQKPYLPKVNNTERTAIGWAKWHEIIQRSEHPGLVTLTDDLFDTPHAKAVLDGVFCHSPFLSQCLLTNADFVQDLFDEGPDIQLAKLCMEAEHVGRQVSDITQVMRDLRRIKRRAALAIGLSDIGGYWGVARVTNWLSRIACATLEAATAFVLREQHERGKLILSNPTDPTRDSGFSLIGMGKLGAGELNYSSDVDVIVLFDPERFPAKDKNDAQTICVRMTKTLVKIMEERTGDGYVFRTDLRLRPDPASTPPAISLGAIETYYEGFGQNWERAAMIKARPVAGDAQTGDDFLRIITPFVWRKHLDYAQIQDIHSIKRQIDAHRGFGAPKVLGHNVKLGGGGIREIEFFAQTQQLIWGGRLPAVRQRETKMALQALAELGQCSDQAATELGQAYDFLRRVEHRLQMVADEQTHSLPDSDEGLANIAAFLGYPSPDAFGTELTRHQGAVRQHYASLFDDAPRLSAAGPSGGNLVFTGLDADPDTLETLKSLGFEDAKRIDGLIRDWHRGRYRAMRSSRARELLTELTPCLLQAASETPEPDATLTRLDGFLQGLPAGVQLFSMFSAAPWLMNLLSDLIGKAPRLAQHLAKHPGVLDHLMTPDFFADFPDRDDLHLELRSQVGRYPFLEDKLLHYRRWANDKRLQIGVQRLQRLIKPHQAASAHSDVAETVLNGLFRDVATDFAKTHGTVPGADMAVLALGRLGSREMTAASDLDLIFVYDLADGVTQSDGEKPLAASQYFARLAQRVISGLTAMTAEGALYETDMRLRPAGSKGPIATSLSAFRQYYDQDAWTWEEMAMVRGRIVVSDAFGSETLAPTLQAEIDTVLRRHRDPAKLVSDVANMRTRLAKQKPGKSEWDIKNRRGGMVDIAFIAQYLALRHGATHPDIFSHNTWRTLDNLENTGLLSDVDGATLKQAHDLWLAVHGMIALTLNDMPESRADSAISNALADDLAAAGDAASLSDLYEAMTRTAQAVMEIYNRLIDQPASRVPSEVQTKVPDDQFPT